MTKKHMLCSVTPHSAFQVPLPPSQVFEAEKMNTKRGLYHKKCFACCKCKSQLDYFNCIEGPDDDIYCKVCYLRYWGPGMYLQARHSLYRDEIYSLYVVW